MAETIQIIRNMSNSRRWTPYVGEEVSQLLRHKGFTNPDGRLNSAGEKILDETIRIMGACVNPKGPPATDTGLVLGYVQSGKTLSFTSLTALASDNGFQLVIIIAGTSTPLSEQSFDRLKKDLRYEDRYDRKWVILKNPGAQEDRDNIESRLSQWGDRTFPRENLPTILLTVMKNGARLRNLTNILTGLPLQRVSTLIIDDEGDQASLNTKASRNADSGNLVNEGEASAIYSRIAELRGCLPHHTFLQYTATPQGNLFINIMDRLSPNFIRLLEPGEGYTGGEAFFVQNPNLIKRIPTQEVPSNENPLFEPPESLLYAIRIFFLGVVAGDIKKDQRNRSMMIHPSRLTLEQNVFYNWVKDICGSWRRLLRESQEEKRILVDEFREPYSDLRLTVGRELPSFEELTGNRLMHAIDATRIIQLNARESRTPTINWRESYAHILVGGQAMDRGFTVEGLTVTYMPRGMGTSQVDTTLQRARFFGYKGKYIGYCRIWLEQETIDAFQQIVNHEEDVRNRLREYHVDDKHLNDWDRETVLSQILNLTRPNILYDDIDRDYFGEKWFEIRAPHDTLSLIEQNRDVLESFIRENTGLFSPDDGHARRTKDQVHLVAKLPLELCLSHLLRRLKYTRESDSQTFSSLRNVISLYLKRHQSEECLVFLMSADKRDGTIFSNTRKRSLSKEDNVGQLFQGKNPKTGEVVYPGDREIREDSTLTIQVHRLRLERTNEDGSGADSKLLNDVPTIAIWVPRQIGADVVRQPRNL